MNNPADRRNHAVNVLKALQTCTYCPNTFRFAEPMLQLLIEALDGPNSVIEAVLAGEYANSCGCTPVSNYKPEDVRREP